MSVTLELISVQQISDASDKKERGPVVLNVADGDGTGKDFSSPG